MRCIEYYGTLMYERITQFWPEDQRRKELFAVPKNRRSKIKESKKIGRYLDLARELKNLSSIKVTDINCIQWPWNGPQRFRRGARRVGNWSTIRDHPNYTIAEIGPNTGKSSGDFRNLHSWPILRTLAIIQTPKLMLVWKTSKEL